MYRNQFGEFVFGYWLSLQPEAQDSVAYMQPRMQQSYFVSPRHITWTVPKHNNTTKVIINDLLPVNKLDPRSELVVTMVGLMGYMKNKFWLNKDEIHLK